MGKSREIYYFQGVSPILAASSLWAVGYFVRKGLLKDISPIALVGLSSFIIAAFVFLVFRMKADRMWRVMWAHRLKFLGHAVSGVLLGTTLIYIGLDHLDLGVTTVLEKLQPLFTLVLASVFLKENLPLRLLPYVAMALLASWFVSIPDPFGSSVQKGDLIGIMAVIGAALSWGITSVISRSFVLKGVTPAEIVFGRFFIAGIICLPFLAYADDLGLKMNLSGEGWLTLLLVNVGPTGCGYLLYYFGLKRVTAPMAGFLELATPLVALILGMVFLSERLSPTQVAAIPLMLFAVWKILAGSRMPPPAEEGA